MTSDRDWQQITLDPGERWWGGAVADGLAMPFGRTAHGRDLAVSDGLLDGRVSGANQAAPLLISSTGRYVWSDRPFTFRFDGEGGLGLDGIDVVVGRFGNSLASAYAGAAAAYFPASGRTPAPTMFTAPQYNTWIEMPFLPTQDKVLAYAQGIVDAGFPPGLLMIDDRWSVDYGDWAFDRSRFPDPAEMNRRLHALGFTVMLWLVPFVSPDSANSRTAAANGWLIKGPNGREVVREWWNGYSTVLDLTNPAALSWLRGALHDVEAEGVDGFKLDAGDLRDYRVDDVTTSGDGPVDQCEAWARFATEFETNELRACWKMGNQPLAQRLQDKPCAWGPSGLDSLIAEGIAQGLIGHAFNCPDMIGGGEIGSFASNPTVDQELFVRFAQCSALFPMMQFSLAPWRVLDDIHLAPVIAAVETRQRLMPEIMALVETARTEGTPILRPLAFRFAECEEIRDQFLLGDTILVAPVLEKGATTRRVWFPPGTRRSDLDGTHHTGPAEVEVPVTLESLPWWRVDSRA